MSFTSWTSVEIFVSGTYLAIIKIGLHICTHTQKQFLLASLEINIENSPERGSLGPFKIGLYLDETSDNSLALVQ